MGWFREDPAHEGYVVGLVEQEVTHTGVGLDARPVRSRYLRELSYVLDKDREVLKGGLPVAVFQVACECGWRSRRFRAPSARWYPCSLELYDERLEEAAQALWGEHYDAEQATTYGRLTPHR